MPSTAVLHVTSLLGGGVDRHVRDITRSTRGPHLVWHVGDTAEVIEDPAQGRYRALDPARIDAGPDAMSKWLASRSVGIIHTHTLSAKARARIEAVRPALDAQMVATLHDVLFLRPDAFAEGASPEPDPEWLAGNSRFLRDAAAVIAPSDFIAALARRHIEGLDLEVIPNGAKRAARMPGAAVRPEFAQHAPRHVVAVLGAIGPHKGADTLEALAQDLAGSGIAIVVIGYLDRQVVPGWRVPGTFFIHGAYADDEVPGLFAAYGARMALFPNRVPESFSYTLSDAWASGLPVLAAPFGALGERISRHGGGWLLPADFDASVIAARLRELFCGRGAAELARVESQLSHDDADRVPPLAAMARSLAALYDRFGLDTRHPTEGDPDALERLIATNLDGSLFRAELARLADEYGQEARAHAATNAAARKFEEQTREWIAKLDGDIASLNADLAREVAERRRLGEENAQLAIHKAAFDLLPGVLRKILLKKILDARS
jgi:glycosyltransferase involved in cell wall biosynthesis